MKRKYNLVFLFILCLLIIGTASATTYQPSFIPTMSNNALPAGYVASASSEYSGSFQAWNAFDKNIATYWATASGQNTGYLQIQLPSAKTSRNYSITSDGGYAPKTWTYAGSNTGAFAGEEVTLDTRTNQADFGSAELRFYEFSNSNSYLYYRIIVTLNQGSALLLIKEMEMYEATSTPGAVANFTATPTDMMYGATVQFNDTSTGSPTMWNYSFTNGGDTTWSNGTTLAYQNLTRIMNTGGNYTIQLWAQNAGGGNYSAKKQYIDVWNWSPASFTGTPLYGAAPFQATFSGSSNNATTYFWIFGDGNTTSNNIQNPLHLYTTPGVYSVNFSTSNAHAQNWTNRSNYITVNITFAADFTGTPTSGYMNPTFPVNFVDMSTGDGLYSWSWLFGDGDSSILRNPSHTYLMSGNYTVNLTVKGSDGTTSSNKTWYIKVSPIGASFASNTTSGTFPLAVQFTDTSDGYPLSWCWTFGDGAWSNAQHPIHTYSSAGLWDVYLHTNTTYESNWSNKSSYINSYYPPNATAAWTSYVISGLCPLIVNFTNQSGNATSVLWDFGDGNTSTQRNPQHSYEVIGSFTVNFTANNTYSSAYLRRVNYVTTYICTGGATTAIPTPTPTPMPLNAPVARFLANTTTGSIPLAVRFYDLSLFNATSWAWDFGDGNTSAFQNPINTYYAVGTYTVSLVATNSHGSDSVTKIDYIIANVAIPGGGSGGAGGNIANFAGSPRTGEIPLVVGFTDLSSVNGTITAYNWSLGDGTYSIVQNPYNTYNAIGTYTISLNVTFTSDGGLTFNSTNATKNNYIDALAVGGLPTVAVPSVIPILPAAKHLPAPAQWIDDRLLWVVIVLVLVVGWLVIRRR